MHTTNTLILGGGQAGLALSHCLTALGRDHLVLERGRVAERWRSERWDSLRLLTPNWMTRLPGVRLRRTGPGRLHDRRRGRRRSSTATPTSFAAPVHEHTTVQRVAADGDGFVVETDDGEFRSSNVVIATGWCDRPAIPAASRHVSAANPPGGAERLPEPRRRSRPAACSSSAPRPPACNSPTSCTPAAGRSRWPSAATAACRAATEAWTSFWWLELIGAFDRTIDDVGDVVAARSEPSLQLVGRAGPLDPRPGHAAGEGRATSSAGCWRSTAPACSFGTDADAVVDAADRRMRRVLGPHRRTPSSGSD